MRPGLAAEDTEDTALYGERCWSSSRCDGGMRIRLITAAAIALLGAPLCFAAEPRDALTRARLLYNQRQFGPAISAAEEGLLVAGRADSADLIAARAYLERFRESAAPGDLAAARERLRRIDPERLGPVEQVELVIGLGEALFLDGSAGAAADIFDSLLAGRDRLQPDARERVLDWWASASDRQARPRPDIERQALYQAIRDRMLEELGANPTSAAASYWLASAARGQGDLQAAWAAAEAGWVRAPLAKDRGAALRGDLDRLVEGALVPERSRALAQPPEVLKARWEEFKEKWKK